MKKILYTLTLIIGFATISFAQEANEIAVSEGKTKLETSKADGSYTFTLTDKAAADIEASSSYYTNYFTVNFDESTQIVKINMVENNDRGRAVIVRFLVASGFRYVNIDGKVISMNDFMEKYLL